MLIQAQMMVVGLIENLSEMVDDIRSREEGQTMVEYGLILSLVALVAAVAFTDLGNEVKNLISQIVSKL